MEKDNTKAFPVTRNGMPISAGMTLRDYFAAKAMPTYCFGLHTNDDVLLEIAQAAYRIADAMMEARGEQ